MRFAYGKVYGLKACWMLVENKAYIGGRPIGGGDIKEHIYT